MQKNSLVLIVGKTNGSKALKQEMIILRCLRLKDIIVRNDEYIDKTCEKYY